ncbi:type II RES/Xre toxin-antitoxin system antitoxin [Arsenicibacter rosenii]|uniref:Uncharacterized protein n=1 Tax=Arsenicibacter rosenii TaxID=1750698 RepID=A0A1S2VA80_9BACT|nr:antitoxin Xre-like helix-turn-helix domain-containing protein [Arsenicibacter rosenii]OIN55644.1 hypothetical protein BLX24_28940 [Arsenicibacter rosenii]
MATLTQQTAGRRTGKQPEKASFSPKWASGFSIIEASRQGVPAKQADELAQLLNLSFKELAAILQIAERTLHRFRNEGRLDAHSSERLLLLSNLAAHGLMVFDSRADALANWLRYPLKELKDQAPLLLLSTISGFSLVDDVLTRIEYGVYA